MRQCYAFLPMLLLLFSGLVACGETGLPQGPVPGGLGVNIHFTRAKAGEMQLLADSGVTWIRMDMGWAGIEKAKGIYNFSSYDYLFNDLDSHHIRPLFVLDYGNPLYEKDSPSTDATRAAFARWAAASVKHFAGRGAIWEIWNEPDGASWKPRTDLAAYIKLAVAANKAIHAACPKETCIGPATASVDFPFCELCFDAGCLEDWAAISVHPYRQGGPETVATAYQKLNELIAKHAPPGKQIPVISGEWGWSCAWKKITPQIQADFLARQWLINRWQHVPLSIYYDWRDDGTDPTDQEQNFGMIDHDYHPKPAYQAAKTLTAQLNQFTFNRRLLLGKPEDYVMVFTRAKETRLVVWSAARDPATVSIYATAGEFEIVSVSGERIPPVKVRDGMLSLTIGSSPMYLIPKAGTKVIYGPK